MHVAFWSPAWPLAKFQNGVVTYVHCVTQELEARGHRVSIFTGSLGVPEIPRGVVTVQPSRWQRMKARLQRRTPDQRVFDRSALIAEAILQVHKREPIDVIEMEESFGWFADVRRLTSIPVLVKLHGPAFMSLVESELETPFAREKIEREGAALRTAPLIVSPSQSTLRETIERYALAPKEARVVVNPLRVDERLPIWNLGACDRRTILFVGRFDLRKGADVLMKAFLLLLQDAPDLKLIFVGPDRGIPAPDGRLMSFADFRDSMFPPALRNNIAFKGPLSNREIGGLRVQAMVTAVASRWESSGYTLLEAMLQGCPTVTSDAGALRESVVHDATGRLARSTDPVDLAGQLRAILNDPASAQRLGRAARQYVIEHHSVTRIVDTQVDLYERLISDSC